MSPAAADATLEEGIVANGETPPWYVPEVPGEPDGFDAGTGTFNQGYMAWNHVSTAVSWSGTGTLSGVNTHLAGVTVGLN